MLSAHAFRCVRLWFVDAGVLRKKYHLSADVKERSIHCMASCLDTQLCYLHTRFVKTYHLSAQVYSTRYTLHGFLFYLVSLQACF